MKHLGKEVLAQIDLMEDQFNEPVVFDVSQVPTKVPPVAAGQDHSAWGYGVGVYGAAQGYRRDVATPLLMANMYGFACERRWLIPRSTISDMVDTSLNRWGY